MTEIRCKNCGKLLGKFEGTGEIKCPRINCGRKIVFNTKTGFIAYASTGNHVALKDRTCSSGHTFH